MIIDEEERKKRLERARQISNSINARKNAVNNSNMYTNQEYINRFNRAREISNNINPRKNNTIRTVSQEELAKSEKNGKFFMDLIDRNVNSDDSEKTSPIQETEITNKPIENKNEVNVNKLTPEQQKELQNKVKEASNVQAPNSKKTEISIVNNQKEKKNWFQANELEDGYQFGDISKTILGTGTDIVQDLATGILSPIENVLDIGTNVVATVQNILGFKDAAKKTRNFADKNITQNVTSKVANASTVGMLYNLVNGTPEKIINPAGITYDKDKNIVENYASGLNQFINETGEEQGYENSSVLGTNTDQVVELFGYTLGLSGIGGSLSSKTGTKTIGSSKLGANLSGGNIGLRLGGKTLNLPTLAIAGGMAGGLQEANSKSNVSEVERWTKGFTSGLTEGVTEGIFGFFGVGGNELTDELGKKIASKFTSKAAKMLTNLGFHASGEAIEEFLSYAGNFFADNAIIDNLGNADFSYEWNLADVGEQMLLAFLSTALTGSTAMIVDSNSATKSAEEQLGRKLTQEEKQLVTKAVVDESLNEQIEQMYQNEDIPQKLYVSTFNPDGTIANVEETRGKSINNPNKKVNVQPAIVKTGNDIYTVIDTETGLRLDTTPYNSMLAAEAGFNSKMINLKERDITAINKKVAMSDYSVRDALLNTAYTIQNDIIQRRNTAQTFQNNNTDVQSNETQNMSSQNDNAVKTNSDVSQIDSQNKIPTSKIKIDEEVTDAYSGQVNMKMEAKIGDNVIGTLTYNEYEGKPNIDMIEVKPEYRRQGIATKLVQQLQEKYPNIEINWGTLLEDGANFKNAVTYNVENTEVKRKQTRLNNINKRLAEYDAKSNQGTLTNEEINQYNRLYDTKTRLEEELYNQKDYKNFVKPNANSIVTSNQNRTKIETKIEEFVRQNPDLKATIEITTSELDSINVKEIKQMEAYKIARDLFSKLHKRKFTNDMTENIIYVTNSDIKESVNNTYTFTEQRKYLKENLSIYSHLDKIIESAKLISNTNELKGRSKYNKWEYYVLPIKIDKIKFIVQFDTVQREDGETHFRVERLYKISEGDSTTAVPTKKLTTRFSVESPSNNTSISQKNNSVKTNINNKYMQNTKNNTRAEKISIANEYDSQGNKLTKTQQEFFKDSKVRDENGNLLVMYHGTEANVGISEEFWFTIFDIDKAGNHGNMLGDGFYFTSNREHAQKYSHSKGNIYETYLNITKPLELEHFSTGDLAYSIRKINPFIEADIYKKDGTIDGYKVRKYLLDNGYDGIHSGDTFVAFNSNQIKNITNQKPTSNPDIRYEKITKASNNKTLIAQHNTSEEKLLEALDLGALPVPSIAITKYQNPVLKYGDITLLFNKDTINPTDRRNVTYNSDIYSTRKPEIGIALDKQKVKSFEKIATEKGVGYGYLSMIEEYVEQNELSRARELIQHELEKNNSNVNMQDVEDIYTKLIESVQEKRIMKSGVDPYTPSGNRKSLIQMSIPYTLDNIVKTMVQKSTKGSESNTFAGLAEIRANLAQNFKSIEAMHQNENNLITSEEMENLKQELNNKFYALVDEIAKYDNVNRYFGSTEVVANALNETAKAKNISTEILDNELDYVDIKNVPKKTLQKAIDFLNSMKNIPTEYFEAKPQRAVGFDEVQKAIVPRNASKEIINKLGSKGIPIEYYSTESERQQRISNSEGVRFEKAIKNKVVYDKETDSLKYNNQSLYFRFDSKDGFKGKDHKSGVSMWEDMVDDYIYDERNEQDLKTIYGVNDILEINDNELEKLKREIAEDNGWITNGASVFNLTVDGMSFFREYDSTHHVTDYEKVHIFTGTETDYGADMEDIVIPDVIVSEMSTKDFMNIVESTLEQNENIKTIDKKILQNIAKNININNQATNRYEKSVPYDERTHDDKNFISNAKDNNYLKTLLSIDNNRGATNAQSSERLIEQEIELVESMGAFDNNIPVTKLTDIRKTIESYLGKKILKGHFREPAYGIYKTKNDFIRVKELKDIDNILHEVGHALDLGQRVTINKETLQDELLKAVERHGGYENDTKTVQLEEGWAEVVRVYIINQSLAEKLYPKTSSFIDSVRQQDKSINDFLTRVQNQLYNYIHQNPRNRILSNMSIGEQTDKEPMTPEKFKKNVMRLIYDKDYLLKATVNDWAKMSGKKPSEIDPSRNAYILTRLASGVNNKAVSMISDGYIDVNGDKLMPGLNKLGEILNNDPQRFNDLRAYLVAKRDLEYKAKSLKTGIRTLDSKAVVKQFENDIQLQEAAQIVYDTLNGVLQYAVNNGLITQENADTIKESNTFYIPFQRVVGKNQVGRRGAVSEIIKGRTGSELDIKDVLENIVVNSANIIQQVENNNVLRALYKQGEELGMQNAIFDVIPTPVQHVGTATLSTWESELKKQGVDVDNIDLEKTIDIFAPNNKIDQENRITSFIDTNGNRVYLQFTDQDIFNSIMALDKNSNSWFLKLMGKLNMPLRYGATMANIGFAIPNMIADTAQAAIYSEAGFIPVIDNVIGILDILAVQNKTVRNFVNKYAPEYAKKIEYLYNIYQQSGASSSTRLSQYRKSSQEIMKDIYGTKNSETLGIKESFNPLKRLLDIMTYIPELSEQSTRFRVFERNYEAYKNKGGSEIDARTKAAIESRDATQDFGRTGTAMREINQLIPFSAARVGSVYTFSEKVTQNTKKTMTRIALLSVLAMLIKAIGYDDKEIEELNQRKKNDNFVLNIGGTIVTIKKPQGVLRSILSLEEYVLDLATGHIEEGKEGEMLGKWLETALMDNLPADEVGGLVPNAIAPIIENAYNKDFYYNSDIVKSYDLDLPESQQYYDYTSQLAIFLGKIFNYSPAKIDNLISGYFGGLGTQVTNIIDNISGKLGLSVEKPVMGAEDNAIGKRFVVNVNKNSASIDEVYTLKDELTKKLNGGTITSEENKQLETLKQATSDMAVLNKQIKAIKKDLTTSGTEKADKIRPLQEQKTDVARKALGKDPIYTTHTSDLDSLQFYPSRDVLSKNNYTLSLTEEMKKEYETLAYSQYQKYKKQGIYSEEYLDKLKSKCKDYAKSKMMQKYKNKLTKSK